MGHISCTTGHNFCITGNNVLYYAEQLLCYGEEFLDCGEHPLYYRGQLLYYGEQLLYYGEQLLFCEEEFVDCEEDPLYYRTQLLHYGEPLLFYGEHLLYYREQLWIVGNIRCSARSSFCIMGNKLSALHMSGLVSLLLPPKRRNISRNTVVFPILSGGDFRVFLADKYLAHLPVISAGPPLNAVL